MSRQLIFFPPSTVSTAHNDELLFYKISYIVLYYTNTVHVLLLFTSITGQDLHIINISFVKLK